MMNFVFQMMDFVFIMMNFALNLMNFGRMSKRSFVPGAARRCVSINHEFCI